LPDLIYYIAVGVGFSKMANLDVGKHPNPTSHPFSKLRSKIDHLASDMSRLGTAVSTTLNPNHRHDEAWEKEVDARMEAMRDAHRFRSFAGERDGNTVKWHVDGHGAGERAGVLFSADGQGRRLLLGDVGDYRFGEGGASRDTTFSFELIRGVSQSIMILDWWLSPELQVGMPP
jgi:phospholipase D1/2